MLYMSSTSDDDGTYTLTITFDVGTDADIAQVKVENRLSGDVAAPGTGAKGRRYRKDADVEHIGYACFTLSEQNL